MIMRLLNWQGIAGIAAGLGLGLMFLVQRAETSHWKKQSASFEQLYHQGQAAFATTVADYRAAADRAQATDLANSQRVAADQAAINQRTANDFETRIASVRADAQRLRGRSQAAADRGAGAGTSMPVLPAAAHGTSEAADKDQLPAADALTATEQAIQLDELIKWVGQQAKVDNNPTAIATPRSD